MNKIIFIFLDGIGLGENSEDNPFTLAPMPFFTRTCGGNLTISSAVATADLLVKGIDACLDVTGLPQSATGQTALFTGKNAAKALGYHLPAYPEIELTRLINEGNILKDTIKAGLKATFANSYSERYFKLVEAGKMFHSVTTLCVYSAGLHFRSLEDLIQGRAVHWDITRTSLQEHPGPRVPTVGPEAAGRHLAGLSAEFDLVLYESFLPDYLGHKKEIAPKLEVLTLIDTFVENVVSSAKSDVSVLITSDHGNIETIQKGSHTRNPVPLLVWGKAAGHFAAARSIMDIKPLIDSWLGLETMKPE